MAYYNPAGQEQPKVQYPAPTVYYATPPITYQPVGTKHFGQHYAKQASIGLGAIQIILACISIAAGITAIIFTPLLYFVGIGIWAGVMYLIAGSIAIAAGKNPKNSLITGTLVCSVFDILVGVVQVVIACIGILDPEYCDLTFSDCLYWWTGAITANSMMIGVASLEIIIGITMMAICGAAIDKASKVQQSAFFPVTCTPPHQPEAVFIQAPSSFQPQQPPPYYIQQHYPSTSNQHRRCTLEFTNLR